MKVVKYALVIVVAIIAIILLVAAFLPSKYAVERKVTINQPVEVVFDYIKMLKNQDNFSVWAMADPNMKKSFIGIDGTVGFISVWDSDVKDVGKGEQEIMKINDGSRIDFELRFKKPFEATDNAYMTTKAIDSTSTLVKWGFDGEMKYPMNIMLLAMDMEEMLGGDLQNGLDKLKVVLEK